MVAVRNYITEDRTLLSFHKGDIIRLHSVEGLEEGETHRHTHTHRYTHVPIVLAVLLIVLCGVGRCYGCIVRKKVMLLEELKRDTPEFGGWGLCVWLTCM